MYATPPLLDDLAVVDNLIGQENKIASTFLMLDYTTIIASSNTPFEEYRGRIMSLVLN